MSAVGIDEPPGLAAAAAADEDAADAASAADSISVAEEEPGALPPMDDGGIDMHQPTGNLDLTDATISQEIQPDVSPGGAPPAPLPAQQLHGFLAFQGWQGVIHEPLDWPWAVADLAANLQRLQPLLHVPAQPARPPPSHLAPQLTARGPRMRPASCCRTRATMCRTSRSTLVGRVLGLPAPKALELTAPVDWLLIGGRHLQGTMCSARIECCTLPTLKTLTLPPSGGSLIKLIYFSMDDHHGDAAAAAEGSNGPPQHRGGAAPASTLGYAAVLHGRSVRPLLGPQCCPRCFRCAKPALLRPLCWCANPVPLPPLLPLRRQAALCQV